MLQGCQIVNIHNESIKGLTLQFEYRGYLISASKIFLTKVVAFDINNNTAFEGDTVEQVIEQINKTT